MLDRRIGRWVLGSLIGLVPLIALADDGGTPADTSTSGFGRAGFAELRSTLDAIPGSHTAYGELRTAGVYSTLDDGSAERGGFSQENQASIVGVRGWIGTEDFKAIYHAQLGLHYDSSPVLTRRFHWVGLRHRKAGQLVAGTTSTSYKLAGLKLDPFYNTPAGRVNAVANYGLSRFNNGFVDNTVEYKTPSFGGFTLNGALFIDDSGSDGHGANAGISYLREGLTGGVQYLHASRGSGLNRSGDIDMLRAHGRFAGEGWSLGGTYEHEFANGRSDVDYLYLAGTRDLYETWTLAGSLGFETDGTSEGIGGTVGVFYEAWKNVSLYGLVSHVQIASESTAAPSRTVVALGANLAFSVGGK